MSISMCEADDHVTLNFNKNTSVAAVSLDTEKAFDTTWHSGLLYILSELGIWMRLITLTASFLINRGLKVLVEGEIYAPKILTTRVSQGSVFAPVLYNLYANNAPTENRTHLSVFADDTCICSTEKHEGYVLCKLQRCLTALNSWYEPWNIKINVGKSQAIYFSRRFEFLCIYYKQTEGTWPL
jgi:hypothetical protein